MFKKERVDYKFNKNKKICKKVLQNQISCDTINRHEKEKAIRPVGQAAKT